MGTLHLATVGRREPGNGPQGGFLAFCWQDMRALLKVLRNELRGSERKDFDMSEIHVRIVPGGVRFHRTEKIGKGRTRRVRGLEMFWDRSTPLDKAHPIFRSGRAVDVEPGESNGR